MVPVGAVIIEPPQALPSLLTSVNRRSLQVPGARSSHSLHLHGNTLPHSVTHHSERVQARHTGARMMIRKTTVESYSSNKVPHGGFWVECRIARRPPEGVRLLGPEARASHRNSRLGPAA